MSDIAQKPPRKLFQMRLGGRILAAVTIPMLILVGINLFFVERAGQQSDALLTHQKEVVQSDQALMRFSGDMTKALLDVSRTLRLSEATRRANLTAERLDIETEIALRQEFQQASRSYLKAIFGFSSMLERTQLPQDALAQYVTYLTRAAGQIDRMASLYTVANSRTLRLARDGDFTSARNNFRFEEQMRSKAIQHTLDEASVKFTELLAEISSLQLAANDQMVAMETATQAKVQKISYGVLAAVAIVSILAALLTVTRSIIRPIRRVPESILNAGKTGARAAQAGETARQDEIGDILRAVQSFGADIEKQQLAEQQKTARQLAEQTRAVDAISHGLKRLSAGDLTARIQEKLPAGYAELRENFNHTLDTLSETITQITVASGSMKNSAAEISQGSDDLSRRTESQAATLEQTAAALDELTASVQSAAENARSVERTMQQASADAVSNREVVQDAMTAMGEIRKSSNHISQIITVIDDISFQTNLLALNAGVEAARAGEAGRGFAVVASEVRALAQRSSDAAMEIKTLIGNSSQQVQEGVQLVDKAGEALQTIVAQVGEISGLVSGIAEGASEQSLGLGEINTGMTQLDQVTQQNAALVEQSTATSHMLNGDATQLAELVSHFQMAEHRAFQSAA